MCQEPTLLIFFKRMCVSKCGCLLKFVFLLFLGLHHNPPFNTSIIPYFKKKNKLIYSKVWHFKIYKSDNNNKDNWWMWARSSVKKNELKNFRK